MKTKFSLALCLVITAFLASCQQDEPVPAAPAPHAITRSENATFTQVQVPEPVVDVSTAWTSNCNTCDHEFIAVLGETQLAGGNKIWYKYPTSHPLVPQTWQQLAGPINGGGAVKIAVTGTWNHMFAVTDNNELWKYANNAWTKLPYAAVDVAVFEDAYTYYLGAASIYGGHPIYRLMPDGSSYEPWPGAAGVSLAVDQFGRPWVTTSLDQIFCGPVASNPPTIAPFTMSSGLAKDIACGVNLMCVGTYPGTTGYPLYTRSHDHSEVWQQQQGEGIQVSGIYGYIYYVVASNGTLFRFN